MTPLPFRPDSPDDFFHDRCDWFRMDLMKNQHDSWAIVLVVDEGYSKREDAEELKTYFADRVAKALVDVYLRDTSEGRPDLRRWLGSSQVLRQSREAS